MQPAEKFAREQPLVPKEAFPMYWIGRENQAIAPYLPPGLKQIAEISGGAAVGTAEAAQGATTLAGLGFIATAPFSGPVLTGLVAATFLGQAIYGTPAQIREFNEAKTLDEKSRIATKLISSYIPAAGLPFVNRIFGGKGVPAVPSKGGRSGTKVVTPEEEGSVKEPVTQKPSPRLLRPDEVPADADAQVDAGTLIRVSSPDGKPEYWKLREESAAPPSPEAKPSAAPPLIVQKPPQAKEEKKADEGETPAEDVLVRKLRPGRWLCRPWFW
jgi:hypothetical protein